jgi:REP element-mobilizing transposase RayT
MELFGDISDANTTVLTEIGYCIDDNIRKLETIYNGVKVHNYVIMPNHVHMLIELVSQEKDIPQIIGLLKSTVSKQSGFSVWQKSYHDRIVRNFKEYSAFDYYIDNNPKRWLKDCYFNDNSI